MTMIQLTMKATNKRIAINIDDIVSVEEDSSDGCFIELRFTPRTILVLDSFDKIMASFLKMNE